MTTCKSVWQFAFYLLVLFVLSNATKNPTGYERNICKYRKGNLNVPVTVYRRRLLAIREQMMIRASLEGPEIHAYILPSYDEHMNYELIQSDQRLNFLTGFTGVKAVAVITKNGAAVWVEDRYVKQADGELDCDWEIYRSNDTVTIADWLSFKLYTDSRVGADPHIVPHQLWMQWERDLSNKLLTLSKINNNLVDMIWDTRPQQTQFEVQVQAKTYAGQKWEDKIDELRKTLLEIKCDAMVVTSLTEIAYILNIRGRDNPFTPVVKSYLIVSQKDVYFYVDQKKLSMGIKYHLRSDCFSYTCVQIRDYNKIWDDLRTYAQIWKKVLVPAPCVQEPGASEAIFNSMPLKTIYEAISPIIFMRAQKNSDEQKGMHTAHVRDGAAICIAMSDLEDRFSSEQWTEEKIKYEIERSRYSQSHVRGLSLRTVVAYGEHSALPYYISSNVTDIEVSKESLLVIESGSQYYEGTTDVSRTFIFGQPTLEMKKIYTNVLAGILRLSQLKFPSDLRPSEVDALVRNPVWEAMSDFPQATGHGIGAHGAVEEPPISVAYGADNSFTFKEGYFFSSESGFYKLKDFGARLKNVLRVIDTGRVHPSGARFLAFKDVTLVPYEPKLIDGTLLSAVEKRWLNEYNANIRLYVGGELKRQKNMVAFYWMMNKTRHIREYLPEEEYRAAMGAASTRYHTSLFLLVSFIVSVSLTSRFFYV